MSKEIVVYKTKQGKIFEKKEDAELSELGEILKEELTNFFNLLDDSICDEIDELVIGMLNFEFSPIQLRYHDGVVGLFEDYIKYTKSRMIKK